MINLKTFLKDKYRERLGFEQEDKGKCKRKGEYGGGDKLWPTHTSKV